MPEGTTLPPSPPLTNPQTGGLYVLALPLRNRNASKARMKTLTTLYIMKAANAKHMGDGRAAVGVPATEGSEWCALLAATNTLPTRHCRQAMPNNGNPVQN